MHVNIKLALNAVLLIYTSMAYNDFLMVYIYYDANITNTALVGKTGVLRLNKILWWTFENIKRISLRSVLCVLAMLFIIVFRNRISFRRSLIADNIVMWLLKKARALVLSSIEKKTK